MAVFVVLIALAVAGCGESGNGESSPSSAGAMLEVVGYSSLGSAYEGLEASFQATEEGEGLYFNSSFRASGEQSRAMVEEGRTADVVHFSERGDMSRLVNAGLVSRDWAEQPYSGIAQRSVVVIGTRRGNPRDIHSFDDLLTKKVNVMTTNPFSSGFGRWCVMAIYGAALHEGKSEAEALDAIKMLFETTAVQAEEDHTAVEAFIEGESEVVLAYENEGIRAQREDTGVEYTIPPSTILIETPIAVTKEASPAAQSFLDYLWSDTGQEILAEEGYRPADPDLLDPRRFPTPRDLFTIAEFGGWGKVNREFFDGRTGKVAKLERELGNSTSG